MGADTVVPGKQPTYGDISKATMAGIAIPGNEEAAKVYNQGAMGELTRQETREQQDKMAAAAAQQHKEKLEADMDIKRAQLARDLQRDDLSHEDKMALIRAHSGDIAAMAASHVKVAEIAADAKKNAAKPQALGATQQTAHVGNRDMIKSIDNAIELLRQNPGAVGGTKGLQGDWVRTKTSTPDEVRAQAALTNVQSGKIHERSGAATSVHENKILQPFLPQLGNDYESNMSKLVGLKNAAEQNNQSIEEFARENNRVVPGDTKLTTYDPEAYKPYSAEEMKVKRPPKSALPQAVGATAPAAAKPVTKVIDGVTYVQTGPQKWAPQ
jgi:hypothetical protein